MVCCRKIEEKDMRKIEIGTMEDFCLHYLGRNPLNVVQPAPDVCQKLRDGIYEKATHVQDSEKEAGKRK